MADGPSLAARRLALNSASMASLGSIRPATGLVPNLGRPDSQKPLKTVLFDLVEEPLLWSDDSSSPNTPASVSDTVSETMDSPESGRQSPCSLGGFFKLDQEPQPIDVQHLWQITRPLTLDERNTYVRDHVLAHGHSEDEVRNVISELDILRNSLTTFHRSKSPPQKMKGQAAASRKSSTEKRKARPSSRAEAAPKRRPQRRTATGGNIWDADAIVMPLPDLSLLNSPKLEPVEEVVYTPQWRPSPTPVRRLSDSELQHTSLEPAELFGDESSEEDISDEYVANLHVHLEVKERQRYVEALGKEPDIILEAEKLLPSYFVERPKFQLWEDLAHLANYTPPEPPKGGRKRNTSEGGFRSCHTTPKQARRKAAENNKAIRSLQKNKHKNKRPKPTLETPHTMSYRHIPCPPTIDPITQRPRLVVVLKRQPL